MAEGKDTPRKRKTIDQHIELLKQRTESARAPKAPAKSASKARASRAAVAKLPIWPDAVRAVPNGILRSALFGAIGKGERRFLKKEVVASVEGVEISYTGLRLDQGDLDLWATLLHMARFQELGSECRFTSYALLKLLGKTDTGKTRATLLDRITRLRANALVVKQGRHTYIGGLLKGAVKDEKTQEWIVELDEKIHPLFEGDQFTQLEWEIRHALNGHSLAQWLYSFYASHESPYPLKIETLHRLCGSEMEQMFHFREKLRKALDAVAEACSTRGEIFQYEIRGDVVHVRRNAKGMRRLTKSRS